MKQSENCKPPPLFKAHPPVFYGKLRFPLLIIGRPLITLFFRDKMYNVITRIHCIALQMKNTPEDMFTLFIFHVCKFLRGEKKDENYLTANATLNIKSKQRAMFISNLAT